MCLTALCDCYQVGWVAFWSLLMFFGLKFAGMLRVSEEIEMAGMDVSKHGGHAYPTESGA